MSHLPNGPTAQARANGAIPKGLFLLFFLGNKTGNPIADLEKSLFNEVQKDP